tara:strand:- start:453 stop:932 length:480 start_codon:yes stop_codon:yes gene_type:complete
MKIEDLMGITSETTVEEEVEVEVTIEYHHASIYKEVEVEAEIELDWDEVKEHILDGIDFKDYPSVQMVLMQWAAEVALTYMSFMTELKDQDQMNLQEQLRQTNASFTKVQGQLLDLREELVGSSPTWTPEEVLERLKEVMNNSDKYKAMVLSATQQDKE